MSRLPDSERAGATFAWLLSVWLRTTVSLAALLGTAGSGQGAMGQGRPGTRTQGLPDYDQRTGGVARTAGQVAAVCWRHGSGIVFPATGAEVIYLRRIYHPGRGRSMGSVRESGPGESVDIYSGDISSKGRGGGNGWGDCEAAITGRKTGDRIQNTAAESGNKSRAFRAFGTGGWGQASEGKLRDRRRVGSSSVFDISCSTVRGRWRVADISPEDASSGCWQGVGA